MTVIIGLKTESKVYMGGDCAGVAGYEITDRKDPKVFKNGQYLIGCTSSFRMIQLLMYANLPKYKSGDLYKHMVTKFIPSIRSLFKEERRRDETKDNNSGHFLVGIKDRLFHIASDFQVGENNLKFHAVGCGADYAKGMMYDRCITQGGFSPEHVITTTIQDVAKFSCGVRGVGKVLHT